MTPKTALKKTAAYYVVFFDDNGISVVSETDIVDRKDESVRIRYNGWLHTPS